MTTPGARIRYSATGLPSRQRRAIWWPPAFFAFAARWQRTRHDCWIGPMRLPAMTISISGYGRRSGSVSSRAAAVLPAAPRPHMYWPFMSDCWTRRGAACGGAVGRRGAVTKLASHHRISRTPYLLSVLSETGHLDVAYKLLIAGHVPILALSGGTWRRHHDVGAVGFMERFARFQDPGMTRSIITRTARSVTGSIRTWAASPLPSQAIDGSWCGRAPGGELSWARTFV